MNHFDVFVLSLELIVPFQLVCFGEDDDWLVSLLLLDDPLEFIDHILLVFSLRNKNVLLTQFTFISKLLLSFELKEAGLSILLHQNAVDISGELSCSSSKHVDFGTSKKTVKSLESFSIHDDCIVVEPRVVLIDYHDEILAISLIRRELVDTVLDIYSFEVWLDLVQELFSEHVIAREDQEP